MHPPGRLTDPGHPPINAWNIVPIWRMVYQIVVDYLVTEFEINDDQNDVFPGHLDALHSS